MAGAGEDEAPDEVLAAVRCILGAASRHRCRGDNPAAEIERRLGVLARFAEG